MSAHFAVETADPAAVQALADILLPSDDGGPGARDIAAGELILRRAARSPSQRALYAAGVEGFDRLARRRYGRPLLALTVGERRALLAQVERVARRTAWQRRASRLARARRRLTRAYYQTPVLGGRHGMAEAVRLFPQLCADVFAVFYTSAAAWDWLGYDGPPMPEGYASLTTPRPAP